MGIQKVYDIFFKTMSFTARSHHVGTRRGTSHPALAAPLPVARWAERVNDETEKKNEFALLSVLLSEMS